MTGQKHTPEAKAKMSAAMTGKMTGENHPMFGRTTYELTNPEGNIFVPNEFCKFCKDMNLCHSAMRRVALGKQKHHKNWTCKVIGKPEL
jgi:hypothetical protein